MAEAVGLVASVIAIAGLADTVLKFVGETRYVVRDMRSLAGETERSIGRIHFAAGTINTAQTTLSTYCGAGGITSQSHVIQVIEDNAAATFLKSESKYLSLHVNKLKEGVYALRKRWVPLATMFWRYFIKDQIEDLREDMEFIQVNLTLLLCCVQLEIALKREKRDEAEIKHYKRVIKQDEREIRRLRRNRVSVSAGSEGIGRKHETDSLEQHEIDAKLHLVLKLAGTLMKTGVVPHSSRSSPSLSSSPSRSTSAASTRLTTDTRTYRRGQPAGPVYHSVSRRLPSTTSAQVEPNLSEVSSRSRAHAQNPPEPPASSANRAESEAGPSQAPVTTRSTSPRSEDGFIGIRSSGEALRIVMSPEQRTEQGVIRYRDEDEWLVAAKIEPQQSFNFMTGFVATELGLLNFVQPLKGDDKETWIMLPSGTRIRPDGIIQLQWCPTQSRPINLQFFVLSRWWERQIVLGAPYVDRLEYYASRRRDGRD